MFEYQRIVVPLDGSELAERAIMPAVAIANAMAAEVILLNVVTPIPSKVDPFHQALKREVDKAEQYLKSVQSRFLQPLVGGQLEVIVGTKIAQSIIRYAEQNKVDLVIMSSQGRSGPGRLIYGSVAEAVLCKASFDIAIICAQVDIEPFAFKRILVPLDGSPLAEQALEPAVAIAGSLSAELILLRAVTIPSDRGETVCSPNVYELMAATKEAEADSYLQQVRNVISYEGVQLTTVTAIGWPPAAIIDQAKKLNVDLIVMSSHNRSGIRRRLYGSVTERVLRGAACATLVVRGQDRLAGQQRADSLRPVAV